MLKKLSLFVLFFSFSAEASVYMASLCADRYRGVVVEVQEIDTTDHLMAKDIIKLEIEESESSEEFIEFKYLRHAMQKIEIGKSYIIGMRNKKLCLVEEVRL